MDSTQSKEFSGYGVLANIFLKIHKQINKTSAKFKRLADKMRFEQYKMMFGERDDDIYIITYPKSGTTMTQMILYQLTTQGEIDFNHIYDVSPWIRNASFKNQPPQNLPSPRIIKSHDLYKDFTKGTKGRFIYVYRNGMDTAISLYHQQKNYNNENLKFDDFIKNFFKSKAWFKHTQTWFKNKKKFPILYIRYEDLVKDKKSEIEKIISFCNIQTGKAAIDRAIKYSDFHFMKKNEHLFGDQPGNPKKTVYDQFIRKGKIGEGKKSFTKEQKEIFDKYYQKFVKRAEDNVFTDQKL